MADGDVFQLMTEIPSLVTSLEEHLHTDDLNLVEILILRTEEYLELLRVLTGKLRTFSCPPVLESVLY